MPNVLSIHRVSASGAPAEALTEANFETDFGLTGDYRSRKGRGRQITLIEAEALELVAKEMAMAGVPPGASRRQVVVSGISLNDTIGKKLQLGSLLISVDDYCHPCSNMERTIGP